MHIYIFGQGSLGKIIKNNLLKNSSNQVSLLPLRETPLNEYVNLLLNKKQIKIIIDLMDPNSIDENTDKNLISKVNIIRDKLDISYRIKQYIYISTAGIYESSLKKIDENSELKSNSLSPYEKLKLANEKSLSKKEIPLTICRVPNIWGIKSNKKSFFNDLFNKYRKKDKVSYFDNDKYVISYINAYDLASLLVIVISSQIFGVVNLSTESFDTRYNLKSLINDESIESINNIIGIRLTSIKLDASKYISKTRIKI